MSKFGVWLVSLLGHLPLGVLYVLSSWVLYPVVRHLVRYRRNVVWKNLALAFPEKSERQRAAIERAFYHHFCDVLVETIRMPWMLIPELHERFRLQLQGFDELEHIEGCHLTWCYGAHYGNWELLSLVFALNSRTTSHFIYHPLHNAAFDRWLFDLRTSIDANPVPMHAVSDTLASLPNDGSHCFLALADQLPKEPYVRHFHRFLGIKTKVLTGPESLIRAHGMNVVYLRVQRLRRGYYTFTLEPLEPVPSDSPYPYTDAYFDRLQQQILEQPELWLWSHDRWRR